jgi:hypothetical protein
MGFKDKYTTEEKLKSDIIIKDKKLLKIESEKTIVDNNTFAIGEQIEILTKTIRRFIK